MELNPYQQQVIKDLSLFLEHTTQHVAIEGKTQESKVKYYNLDMIISLGYRVNNSSQATY